MTCVETLRLILDADLAELSREHPGPLGQHLSGCGRCARIAEQLRGDSTQLAAAVTLPAGIPVVSRRSLWRPVPVGVAATAVVAAVLMVGRGGSLNELPVVPVVETIRESRVADQPATPMAPDAGELSGPARPRHASETPRIAVQAVTPVAFEPPVPVMPVPFEPPIAVSALSLGAVPVLAMSATVGQRARPATNLNVRVLRSPDPDITVLWFH